MTSRPATSPPNRRDSSPSLNDESGSVQTFLFAESSVLYERLNGFAGARQKLERLPRIEPIRIELQNLVVERPRAVVVFPATRSKSPM